MEHSEISRFELYQRMVEEVQDYAILLLDTSGNVVIWNLGAEKIKGYKATEIIGKNFRLFYEQHDRESGLPEKLLNIALKNGRAEHTGWRVRKDGTRFWGSIVITAIHDKSGNHIGFTKVTRDLTEKKLAEDASKAYQKELETKNEALRRSEERYHRMVEEIQDYAIFLLDTNGVIQNWNKGVEKIKGYSAKDVIGKNFSIFYTEEDIQSGLSQKLLEEAAANGRAFHEGWRVRKDGSRFWGHIVITALHGEDGSIIGYSKITRDLTEKKEADDRMLEYSRLLEQKNADLEQFAYVASHDIKEPLRKIVAFGDLLMHNYQDKLDERAVHYISRMQNASSRMMQLIEDLLELSRVTRSTAPKVKIDLNILIEEVLHDLELTIREKKAIVNVGSLPAVSGRVIQLQQVFQNLITNALKFNRNSQPRIDITGEGFKKGRQPFARIVVKDNGIGFSNEFRDKIFEIFQRLQAQAEYPGTGIGLALCRKIIENHGGTIEASGEEDKGAVFTIELPV